MGTARLARWLPLSGIVFVALWLVSIALSGNIESGDSDQKIRDYYADSGHRHRDIVLLFLVLAAALFFVWFLTVLRGRLAQAQGSAGALTSAAFGAGLVSTAMWTISMALFTSPSLTREDTSKFVLDPNLFRITQDIGYAIWFSATTIAAVTVIATSIVSLKAGGLLPKWLAWLAFVVALTMLVAFFFVPFLIFLGWVLVVSIVLIWRSYQAAPAAAPPVAT
jgi:hypothetical protein